MLVIIQPWFTAAGHPAQSLINTAKTIGQADDICYLISCQSGMTALDSSRETLRNYGQVTEFSVNSSSLREGTFKALLQLRKLIKQSNQFEHIFFLDAHLVLLALFWPFFFRALRPKRLSVIYLMGPERILNSKIAAWLVKRFVKRNEVTLYLRTEELAAAWHELFCADSNCRIRYISSLEIPDDEEPPAAPVPTEHLKFAVIGQVRRGKGLDWLIPMFQGNPQLGKLTIAGTFNSADDRKAIKSLSGYVGFVDKFLTEDEILEQAIQQDYLLMLYDGWDTRMESAVLYLAARTNRPIITYNKGWVGRKVGQFHCGLLAPEERSAIEGFFLTIPRPGSSQYKQLLKGLSDFRKSCSGEFVRRAFLTELACS